MNDWNRSSKMTDKQRALQLLQANRLLEAKSAYREICQRSPRDAEAWFLLGYVEEMMGVVEEAVNCCRQAVSIRPQYVEAHILLGNLYKKQRNYDEAMACFHKVLGSQPRHHGAQNNLGNVLMILGKYDEAATHYREAIRNNPKFAEAHNNLGTALRRLGQLEEAEGCYRRALKISPAYFAAANNLGELLQGQNKLEEAASWFRDSIRANPNYAVAYFNLGNILKEQGKPDDAMENFRHAIRIRPDYVEAYHNLGFTLQQQERLNEAMACYREGLRFNPNYAPTHNNLGNVVQLMGRQEEAQACYRMALQISPEYAEAYCNLGNLYQDLGRWEEAVSCYRKTLELKPGYAVAHNNMGNALQELGRLDEAVACFEEAISLDPGYAEAHANLGLVLHVRGMLAEAKACFEKALQLKTNFAEMHSNLLFFLNYRRADPDAVFHQHRLWSEQQAVSIVPCAKHSNSPEPERRLRVGYVSPDLRDHSVAFFFEPLLANHDPAAVETICYADVLRPDATTTRLRATAAGWRNICGLNHRQVSEMILHDGIDILVDLAGHTAKNRLLVFARQPAPIQVTYLGYPNTTGLSTMDYRFTDAEADPPGQTEAWHTEQLVRLPHGFLCFRAPDDAPPVMPPPCLTAGHVTFGSFNVISKITPEVIACWARLLQQVPGARLLLKNKSFSDAAACKRYEAHFATHGIAPERLDLLGWIPNQVSHLAIYDKIDLALDTFPYHGTTTTCQALWMGVPVITLAGATHAERVGVSLLTQTGLPELIAANEKDYINLAVALANDPERLSQMRTTLRSRLAASPLCDGKSFARDVEAAYREMWRGWCANHPKT